MFQQTPHAGNGAGKGSVFYRGVSLLGTCAGAVSAVLFTPTVFGWTRAPLSEFLTEKWGDGLSGALVWVVGGAECIGLYVVAKLLVSSLLVWGMASLAARGFPGMRA